MTRMMCAWCKANACVRSGQHEKAIHWLLQTQEILEAGPLRDLALKVWTRATCLARYSFWPCS
jgi:hypothetical protein